MSDLGTHAVSEYDSLAYKRSRNAYRFECTFEYFVSLLVTGVFLAKLLSYLEMDDATVGIVSSLISFAYLFQLATLFVVQRVRRIKLFTTLIHTAGRLFFCFLFLLPFLPFAASYRMPLVFLCVLTAYFGNYFVTTMIYKWGTSFVEPHHRARFTAGKEMLSLLFGMAVTFGFGFALDEFELLGNLRGGFLFIAVGILVFSVCDLICLLLMKKGAEEEKDLSERPAPAPFREVVANTLGNRKFRKIIYLSILYNVGLYVYHGFLGTYYLQELSYTVAAVQIITIVATLLRFFLSPLFGAFADRFSYARGIELGLAVSMASLVACMFMAPSTRWLLVVYTILCNISSAGTGPNLINATYSYVDSRYFVQASAIKNSIGGIAGFAVSLLASKLLSFVQARGNTLFGIPVYGQQVLAAIGLVITLVAMLYTHFAICREKTIEE